MHCQSWGLIVAGVDKLKCTHPKLSKSSSFKKQELPQKLVLSKGPQVRVVREVFSAGIVYKCTSFEETLKVGKGEEDIKELNEN